MQDGRYAFRGKKHLLLPLLFLLPQLAITVVFFFYPAGEALTTYHRSSHAWH